MKKPTKTKHDTTKPRARRSNPDSASEPSSTEEIVSTTPGIAVENPRDDEDQHERLILEAKDLLTSSGLFDPEFYLNQNPDVASAGADPFRHFFLYGFAEGRKPNAIFDPRFYLESYPDVAASGMNPLLHYAYAGEKEGRRPNSLFDPLWYRTRYAIADNEYALKHYLHNKIGPFSPIPEFDADYYLKTYPDIAAAKIDPFEHFLSFGYKEGRNPSGEFDTRFYVQRYFKGDLAQNPLVHFLQNRHLPGYYMQAPQDEATIPAEVRRFTKPGRHFEEFRPLGDTVKRRAKVLAYYLTQFHAFEENDRWWGKGFTEWTNIARGLPRFKDHYQPRVPRDLGFYNLADVETLKKQIALAKAGGIHGFVFYYYWFNRHRLMERPLEAFLQNTDMDMPFCLMWANENWTRRWDGMESEVLIAQDYRSEDNVALIDDFARHFSDRRYIRLDGRPLLMIYRPGIIPNADIVIEEWRKLFKQRHNENPIIIMGQSFNDIDPRKFKLDGAIEFPPHKITATMPRINDKVQILDDTFSGNIYDYDEVVEWSLTEKKPDYPLIKTLVPSWDNDARRQGTGLVITNATPAKYEKWLDRLIDAANRNRFFGEAIVCVNAWNEWCEGAYLEPDLHFGSAYLNATARAVAGIASVGARRTILLVGHDAFPSGAQHLLLNIGRQLKGRFGFDIEFLLLSGGEMEEDYRSVAPVSLASTHQELVEKLVQLRERGVRAALCNTSVTGTVAAALKAAGLTTVMLVHELPRILKEKHLEKQATDGISSADTVIFPCDYVRDKVLDALGVAQTSRHIVRPQGMYKEIERNEAAGRAVRNELGVASDEKLVLGVGYADFRKGFDLFFQVWQQINDRMGRVHFAWVGNMDPTLAEWMAQEMDKAKATGRFHFVGYKKNVDDYFSAADAFLLSSREDPFPTVALEAMSAEVPVFAFEDTGGIPAFLKEADIGYVSPYCTVPAMADQIVSVFKGRPNDKMIARAKDIVDEDYIFSDYVRYLVPKLMPDLASVSVVVPNYNYAHCLPERLMSIFEQTHPVAELIVLDDKSKDNSVDVIIEVAEKFERDIELIVNEENSGSVFKQWTLASSISSGEFVWIAEADDLADPGFLSNLVPMMQADPSIMFAFSDSRAIDADGSPLYESYKDYYATIEPEALLKTEIFEGKEFVRRFLALKNVILNVSAVLWRREALEKALRLCQAEITKFKMAGDWRLYLEVLSWPGSKIGYVSDPLNVHRRHAASVTHSLNAQRHIEEIEECQRMASRNFALPKRMLKAQKGYLDDVTAQLLKR